MSDEFKKALDTALSRIAAMESELSGFRNRKAEPAAPAFDADKFKSAFTRDPIGTLKRMGATQEQIDHSVRAHVAFGLGDEAPAHLKVMAQMGPQIDATHTLMTQVESLSRQLESLVGNQKRSGVRDSFNALTADKTKYPNLAKALAADPKFVDDDLEKHGGSAEELASAVEARLQKVAAIFLPNTASAVNADTTAQSSQGTPAAGSAVVSHGDMPPLPKAGAVWNEAEHARVRDEIVRKHTSQ